MRNYTIREDKKTYSAEMMIKLGLLIVGVVIGVYLFLTFALIRLVDATMVQYVEEPAKHGSHSLYLGQTAISEGEEYDVQPATGVDFVQPTVRAHHSVFNQEGNL